MNQEQIAKVLAEHAPSGVSGYGFEYVLCRCDRTNWMKAHEFPAHQAAVLAPLFAAAKAEALREAADGMEAEDAPIDYPVAWLRTRATHLEGRALVAGIIERKRTT